MTRSFASALLLALAIVACQSEQPSPTAPLAGTARLAISDGANDGNPYFYFLPPLVNNPSFSGVFDPDLLPTVEICRLQGTAPNETCETDGSGGRAVIKEFTPAEIDGASDHYHVGWDTDGLSEGNYRIHVQVGSTARNNVLRELGYRDVQAVSESASGSDDYYVFSIGTTVQIKFRVEEGALCFDADAAGHDCGAATLGTDGGTVSATSANVQTFELDQQTVLIIEELECDVNPSDGRVDAGYRLPMDIPQFPGCYRISTEPKVTTLPTPAVVGVCLRASAGGLSEDQEHLLQIHRFDRDNPGAGVEALPNVFADIDCSAFAGAHVNPVMRFARSTWRALERRFNPLAAEPAYAAHNGFGGGTGTFSDFVWALPSQMAPISATSQTGEAGQPVGDPPAVLVTDGNGDPVEGASVTFSVVAPATGQVVPTAPIVTGADGIARVASWTLAVPNPNVLEASGRGIADPADGGPFADPEYPVELGTGSVQFTATACGSATIDGVLSAGEWACAEEVPFTANLSGGSTPATLFWMNDDSNLYLAVRVVRSGTDRANSLRFDFDNDNDGAAEVNDDVILHASGFADRFLNSKCVNSTQSSCGPDDASAGGSKNGSSAFGSTGAYFVYEMSHPLRSGDARDFYLNAGDRVGAFLTLSIGKGAQGNTQFPGFRHYLEIEIK